MQIVEAVAAADHLDPDGHGLPGQAIGSAPGRRAAADCLLVAGEGIVDGPAVNNLSSAVRVRLTYAGSVCILLARSISLTDKRSYTTIKLVWMLF
jgi:hypothetical protein